MDIENDNYQRKILLRKRRSELQKRYRSKLKAENQEQYELLKLKDKQRTQKARLILSNKIKQDPNFAEEIRTKARERKRLYRLKKKQEAHSYTEYRKIDDNRKDDDHKMIDDNTMNETIPGIKTEPETFHDISVDGTIIKTEPEKLEDTSMNETIIKTEPETFYDTSLDETVSNTETSMDETITKTEPDTFYDTSLDETVSDTETDNKADMSCEDAAMERDHDEWEPELLEEWKPPTEAEMKVLQAKRERSDKISKIMGDYLLKGYKMLGSSCGVCGTILLQSKQGVNYCVACSELVSDTDKDDPALSSNAARRQAEEQHQRGEREESSVADARDSVPLVLSLNSSGRATSNSEQEPQLSSQVTQSGLIYRSLGAEEPLNQTTGSDIIQGDRNSRMLLASGHNGNVHRSEPNQSNSAVRSRNENLDSATTSRIVLDSKAAVEEKLQFAVQELKTCSSVEYSIQLCNLIKSCADTLSALNQI